MTQDKTLVTLGCSWTRGVGVGYDEADMWNPEHNTDREKIPFAFTEQVYDTIKGSDYPDHDVFVKNRNNKPFFKKFVWRELLDYSKYEHDRRTYDRIAWDDAINDQYSFRGILSRYMGFENLNFSQGASSNEQQFHHMYKIFGNPEKREQFLKRNPVVLWGITSTARIFRNNQSIMLREVADTSDDKELYTSLYIKLFYDHDECVASLGNQIEFWNIMFEHYDIPVVWFDTFNTHKYPHAPRNFVQGGDLLTQMINHNKSTVGKIISKAYHTSDWRVDDPRVAEGVRSGLLNPMSHHPTKRGHELIAEILHPYVETYK